MHILEGLGQQEWPKHVGGILCLYYKILLYIYVHFFVFFTLPN